MPLPQNRGVAIGGDQPGFPAGRRMLADMVLKIVQAGEPVLRATARDLTPTEIRSAEIQQLIALMRDTMHDAPGVGLAAPQIGVPLAAGRHRGQRGIPRDGAQAGPFPCDRQPAPHAG